MDRTIDLEGTWIVPPFAEAHNHNLGGVEERDRSAIERYLSAGVFYVKIQGNTPLSDDARRRLAAHLPDSVDAVFADATLTAAGGHPIGLLAEVLLPRGCCPGETLDSLRDRRFFEVDTSRDLDRVWPILLGQKPDFVKTILLFSEEFEKRRDDAAYFGQKGLDPRLLPEIAARAHAAGLRVSAHVATGADFHHALGAGVDEIAHLPSVGATIAGEDAALAARSGVVVVTSYRVAVPSLIRKGAVRESDVRRTLDANLAVLRDHGVALAIGSDDPSDTSAKEFDALRSSGAFDNLTLLRMWTETGARMIFPTRRIGRLEEGYEASFLALDGNPLEDLEHVHRIAVRFKEGFLVEAPEAHQAGRALGRRTRPWRLVSGGRGRASAPADP